MTCLLIGGVVFAQSSDNSGNVQGRSFAASASESDKAYESRRLTINYSDLVDRNIITHSGKKIGELLDVAAKNPSENGEDVLANLQPYLEPFSFVCNYMITAAKSDDAMPYLTAVANYRDGLRQPAWAGLFREGHYQLFVGDGRARLFLKGKRPEILYKHYYRVIRHPLREALITLGLEKMNVEVYAFENSYASQTIRLDLRPYLLEVRTGQLGPKTKSLPLVGLADFFDKGVILEAAEINRVDNFYLYGMPPEKSPSGEKPLSLEDFAVVYRAFFHYGHNAPYISLDRSEDNRYAKVNFGGLLGDTRIGDAVLEADKLFKTMSTGLDPNSRAFIKEKIIQAVPGFLTEDERELNEKGKSGRMQIRYWFYPSKIGCVTDGQMAVIHDRRFLADAERSDREVRLDRAQRDTINHLNDHFPSYSQALSAYRELDAVGRMMALVVWLRQTDAEKKLDFDELLTVELSAFKTPRRTKKLLAVTAESYVIDAAGGKANVKQKVFTYDSLLDTLESSAIDQTILDKAGERFSQVEEATLIPSGAACPEEMADMENMKSRLNTLDAKIERDQKTMNRYNPDEIKRFNALVAEYNDLSKVYNDAVASYNASRKDVRYKIHRIVSVGGGINLRPNDFAEPILVDKSSPLIQRVRTSPDIIRSSQLMFVEKTKRSGDNAYDRAIFQPVTKPWRRIEETMIGDIKKIRWINDAQETMCAEFNIKTGYVRHRVATKEYASEMVLKPGRKEMIIRTSEYPAEIIATGDFSEGGTVILKKGKAIE